MERQVELGARVRAENETVGIVEKIVVDPEHHEPGYLVVKQGRIPPRQRHIVVPVSLVSEVLSGAVTLATTPAALASFPEYEVTVRKGEYQKPIPLGYPRPYDLSTPVSNQGYMVIRARSVPDTSVSVEQGMAVRDAQGRQVGRVHGLILDSDKRQASHIVVRLPKLLADRDRVVPVDLVDDVHSGSIHLRITAAHVDALTIYQPEKAEPEARE